MRLRSGEEIMGQLEPLNPEVSATGRLQIIEPLLLDYIAVGSVEGKKQQLVYLSRYSPFTGNLLLLNEEVVAIHPVLPIVEEYYMSSLEYVKSKSDLAFQTGISKSAEFMRKQVTKFASKEEEELAEEFSDFETPSPTRH